MYWSWLLARLRCFSLVRQPACAKIISTNKIEVVYIFSGLLQNPRAAQSWWHFAISERGLTYPCGQCPELVITHLEALYADHSWHDARQLCHPGSHKSFESLQACKPSEKAWYGLQLKTSISQPTYFAAHCLHSTWPHQLMWVLHNEIQAWNVCITGYWNKWWCIHVLVSIKLKICEGLVFSNLFRQHLYDVVAEG